MNIRFGLHGGQQDAAYADFVELWHRGEELGYDWISHHDHFVPLLSDERGPIFDGLTMLAGLASETERVRIGVVVLGVTYRHPALVAKMAATIDHMSGGRLELGIGAAWYEREHRAFGYPFPPIGERMDMLDEACTVMRSLWDKDSTTFEGPHFPLDDAGMEPKPVQDHLPLLIGGAGEKRTLRIVAEHADVWNNHLGGMDAYRHKLDVLARHCDAVGRDPAEIRKSLSFRAVVAPDEAAARERGEALLAELVRRGGGHLTPEQIGLVRGMTFFGTPEGLIEHLRPFAELGVGDFLLNSTPPIDWQTIELVAGEVMPAIKQVR